MSEFTNRRQVLEEKIGDLEETLAVLKGQLKAETEREQHEAIDKLEEYLGDLDNKHANLQEFWKVLREEIGDLFGKNSSKSGTKT
ncbi:hypothetical protein [Labrenzia sp. CE80]|uniref:hypothetical protein n=1 Tax=Labrenzia sp. CE80 TaxID=1788986 RepID=UPI00129A6B7C|nr:hypothetical protein [Labrenzia sp. CE80]